MHALHLMVIRIFIVEVFESTISNALAVTKELESRSRSISELKQLYQQEKSKNESKQQENKNLLFARNELIQQRRVLYKQISTLRN
jgi:hypothetical protein